MSDITNSNTIEDHENYGQLAGQFLRFATVGIINTAINFAVLNFLSYMTGVTKGPPVVYMAALAFALATLNSYFMNKYWAFHNLSHNHEGRQIVLFLVISLIGLAINSTLVYLISTFVSPMFGVSGQFWLNIAAAVATAFSLTWNFIGYKFFVFNR